MRIHYAHARLDGFNDDASTRGMVRCLRPEPNKKQATLHKYTNRLLLHLLLLLLLLPLLGLMLVLVPLFTVSTCPPLGAK